MLKSLDGLVLSAACLMLLACTTQYVDDDDDDGDTGHYIDPPTAGSGGTATGVGPAGPGTGSGAGGASTTTSATTSGSGGATTSTTGAGGTGGAGGNVPMGPPCEVLAAELCARSCDCTMNDADPRCRYLYDGPHPDGGSTIQMRTQEIQTCAQDLAVDLCGDTTKSDQELEHCISQLDAGMCVVPSFAGGKHAYEVTIDCFTVFECEAGPCLQ